MRTRRIIHKNKAPLNLSVSTEVSGSTAQIYRVLDDSYSPDYTKVGERVSIQPKVYAWTEAHDHSWVDGDYTSQIADGEWYANGVKINQVAALKGYYQISQDTNSRYRLTITRNLTPGEHYDFSFFGKIADTRDNTNVEFRTDIVPVTVTEDAPNEIDLSVVHDTAIKYYPLLDKLKEYDWKVANVKGFAASEDKRRECFDGNEYILSMPIVVSYGARVLGKDSVFETFDRDFLSKCSFHLYAVTHDDLGEHEILLDESPIVVALTKDALTIDQRFIPDGSVFVLKLFYNEMFCSAEYLTFKLVVNKFTAQSTNMGDFKDGDVERYDKAVLYNEDAAFSYQYPSAYFLIKWYTQVNSAKEVYHGEGECVMMKYSNIGVGTQDTFDVIIDVSVKAQAAFITTNENGKVFITDSDGRLITTDLLVK